MKLMLVTPYFYPKIGGLENYAYNIAKGLKDKYGWEIVVVTSNHEGGYKEETIDGMKIYRLKRWFKISNTPINPMWYFQIKKIIQKEKPDVINGHSPVPFIADVAARVAGKIPFVLTYHADSMVKGNVFIDIFILGYEKIITRSTIIKSTKLIATSDFLRYNFLKSYIKKSITITQGVKEEFIKRNNLKKNNDILFVGNFSSKIKGFDYLLESLLTVKKIYPNITLTVVGSGNYQKYEKILKLHNFYRNIIFKGPLTGEKLITEYQRSRILVVPSVNENFPTVIIEGMVSKLPVVASNIGGIPQLIKNSKEGFLVKSRDSKKLAEALIYLLDNPAVASKMGKSGYLKAYKEYNWNNRIKSYNSVLNGIEKK